MARCRLTFATIPKPPAEQILPLVYDELRRFAAEKVAQEKRGQTLQGTAPVHEAYIRPVDVETVKHWDDRGHFFSAAAEAMRRILVENARRKRRAKHGGEHARRLLAIGRARETPGTTPCTPSGVWQAD